MLLILTDQSNPIKNPNQLGVTFMFDTILKGRHEHKALTKELFIQSLASVVHVSSFVLFPLSLKHKNNAVCRSVQTRIGENVCLMFVVPVLMFLSTMGHIILETPLTFYLTLSSPSTIQALSQRWSGLLHKLYTHQYDQFLVWCLSQGVNFDVCTAGFKQTTS